MPEPPDDLEEALGLAGLRDRGTRARSIETRSGEKIRETSDTWLTAN